ncbi:MAG: ubiquitin-conjugating enzyme E2 [Oligosphaeraceae bacterium]
MMRVRCPECGRVYQLAECYKGRKAQCAKCGRLFEVKEESLPSPSPVSAPVSAPSPSPVSAPSPSAGGVRLSPRQRRLVSDERLLREAFASFPLIEVVERVGTPPERYVIEYHIRGIERLEGTAPVYRDSHRVSIELPGTYPRTPPLCRMLTPVFHPNIEPSVICIGDHWTAAERLCDLVVRIGEMIAYQSYNIQSPLDGEAAMWADLHQEMLPIDNRSLMPPEWL